MRLLLPLILLCLAWPVAAEPPPVGKPAPGFSLRDREGALVSLADLAYPLPEKPSRPRQVVLLDFFRTDCQPCKKALPRLIDLHRRYASKGFKIILMALLEEEEGEEKLERFLARTPVPFLVLVDAYGAAAKKYIAGKSGYEIPFLFLVDRSGTLRQRLRGGEAEAMPRLKKQIEELLR